MGILLLGEAHERFSNTGVQHLLVDMISTNNARYCDKESTSSGHFLYRAFLKMAAGCAPILQEGSNFYKMTAKKFVLPPKFQKVRFKNAQKVHEFLEYLRYTIPTSCLLLRFNLHVIPFDPHAW